mgnify:FL=1
MLDRPEHDNCDGGNAVKPDPEECLGAVGGQDISETGVYVL